MSIGSSVCNGSVGSRDNCSRVDNRRVGSDEGSETANQKIADNCGRVDNSPSQRIRSDEGNETAIQKIVDRSQVITTSAVCTKQASELYNTLLDRVEYSSYISTYFKNFPKGGDIHSHVDGGIYSNHLLNFAIENKLYFYQKSGIYYFITEEEYDATSKIVQTIESEDKQKKIHESISGYVKEDRYRIEDSNLSTKLHKALNSREQGQDIKDIILEFVKNHNLKGYIDSGNLVLTPMSKSHELCENWRHAETAKSLAKDSNFGECVSMKGASHNSKNGDNHFFSAFYSLENICRHMPLKRKLELLLENTDNQNIDYLEIAIWFERKPLPSVYLEQFDELFNAGKIDQLLHLLNNWVDDYVCTARKKIEECKKVTDSKLIKRGFNTENIFSIDNPVVTRFIIDNDRTLPSLAEIFASFAASMALEEREEVVVGSGFAGKEHEYNALNFFDQHMEIIKSLKDRYVNANVTLHAGEFNDYISYPTLASRNVRGSLVAQPNRLGHCVAISEDNKLMELIETIKKKEIAIEVCLSSNENVLGITNGNHPIILFIRNGVPFVFCTDDEGVNRSSLSKEFAKAAIRYGKHDSHLSEDSRLTYHLMKKSSLQSIRKSFLSGESIYKSSFLQLCDLFNNVREKGHKLSKEQEEFLECSDKAKMEYRLERKFVHFEQTYTQEFIEKHKISMTFSLTEISGKFEIRPGGG
ncbi:MAG: hypothetical protein VX777_01455 [Chlamydiota bacterium]|nr:hypothetical protein [Chlamydiota bacterium]